MPGYDRYKKRGSRLSPVAATGTARYPVDCPEREAGLSFRSCEELMAIFVIGRQRSGTTVFRHFLSSNPRFVDVGEILHNRFLQGQARSTEERFYRYVHELAQTNPEVIHPGHHRRLLTDFLREVELRHSGRNVVIDVKYNLLFMVNDTRPEFLGQPALCEIISIRKDIIFHIIRRNKLRLLISEKMANATGQWSLEALPGAKSIKTKVEINPQNVIHMIKRELDAENVVSKMLQKLNTSETLYYEELFDETGMFESSVAEKVEAVLGEHFVFCREPRIIKQNPETLSELLVNDGAILSKLKDTPFEWMWDAP
jgi:hypothetical protein